MNDKKSEQEIKKEIQEEIERQERQERSIGDIHKESYQPTEDSLDTDNPPNDGSGVPEKEDD